MKTAQLINRSALICDEAFKLRAVPRPVDVALSRRLGCLTITWEDGAISELPTAYLRGWCPCAACQGHGTEIRFKPADPGVGIESMYEAGAYAIHIRFTDGHDSGIFTWDWLWLVSPTSPPAGLKQGRFIGKRYEPLPNSK